MAQEKQVVLVPDYLTVRELAELISASPIEVMKRLIANGIMASINQQVDYDTAAIVIEELGYEAQSASAAAAKAERDKRAQTAQTWRRIYTEEKSENLIKRPPIVTILGHVDHGKTTLLDTIRRTKVAEGEAGGITQRIGAYRVKHNDRQITFIDTPGHEAFTAMRARGANATDIAILVVAADDGVMPTTREALTHARAANVPIIVAITKVDKRNANVERVKQEIAELGLTPYDWDGDTFVVPVAAVQKEGIEDLLEAIILVADDSDIVANPKANPAGVVLEAEVDRSKGVMATLLVLNGTLEPGTEVVVGNTYGRVKAMYDENGKPLRSAGPSTPVALLGLHDLPQAGDTWEVVKNEKVARQMVGERKDAAEAGKTQTARALTLEDIFSQYKTGEIKELNLIVRVDFQGSLQPVVNSFEQLSEKSSKGIKLRVLSADVGNISESDIMLASASGAIVLAFNVDVDSAARRSAEQHHVEIRQYDVIYKMLEDIELALEGMLEPVYADKTIGVAEVRQVFRIPKVGTIAGSMVKEGEIRRNARARVKRAGHVIAENVSVASLKRLTEDVREVRAGFECGIALNNVPDIQVGDIVEFYVSERVS
ncbi:MAG: translation initiation factor IF-2 [Chloroflexi bacterium]|uniref:translation initiation factor IF-2 n=1 Tax=Candidatus Flexifilum breve TaxID=3140694 RepID=UPI003134DA9E|nr:translation initiation factor IF-2 [Chloroflexota bacterium]